MGKFDQYKIELKDFGDSEQVFDYHLDDEYFTKINSPEVQKGTVDAVVTVVKKKSYFELFISIDGKVLVPCDRCLDDMEQPVKDQDIIQVKLGDEYADDGDFVIIPEKEGEINIAWFLYELIALSIPLKHVHEPGKCNKLMISQLNKYLARSKNDDDYDDELEIDEDNENTDPRWDGLKNIFDNN